MSATAEGRLWRPEFENIDIWYATFEVLAASAPPDSAFFHGPHVAPPVATARVREGLLRWESQQADGAPALPTLEEMRAELAERRRPVGGAGVLDDGSPCHDLWHWLHG